MDDEKRLKRNAYMREYQRRNKDKKATLDKRYYLENKEKVIKKVREHQIANRAHREKYIREYYIKNKEKINKHNKEYRLSHLKEANAFARKYLRENYYTNVPFRLRRLLRRSLYGYLKQGSTRSVSAVRHLGCSVQELKFYLESKFQVGMSWKNWGINGWHIDHIRPLSSFDFSNGEEARLACHYTNLQPLWAKDNLTKSDKWSSNDN